MAIATVLKKVKKRDGSIVVFDKRKIEQAIKASALEVLGDEAKASSIALRVADIVVGRLSSLYRERIPTIESIQDTVENILMEEGYNHIAKSYILYREKHKELRIVKSILDLKDDLKLPINSMEVLKRRYLLKDENQSIIETPSELFRRVAFNIALAEKNFRSAVSAEKAEERFYQMMRSLEFLPNSPTLMNAGTSLGQLSACFVIPVSDSIDDIFDSLKDMAKIHQTGGGTGFNFSNLRPKGDIVRSTKGLASGPVSFMSIFDSATAVIVQGGRRRGANMGILRVDHPDIFEFIDAKTEKDRFSNFNLSVGITDRFMEAVRDDGEYDLANPRTRKSIRRVKARVVLDLIVDSAWRTGDPGLVFLDEINRYNPTPDVGSIEATNPCGELPLLSYESCNLGSINLSKMVAGKALDWPKLREEVRWGVRFLDNVIEVNKFPLSQIKRLAFANRKIGLGVMGFADMLIRLGIPYDSRAAVTCAEKVMKFIRAESLKASAALAQERGVFPNFKRSIYKKRNLRLRNATVNTVAPTGTISIIAGCSSGIEPLFAVSFMRNVLAGTKLFEVNPLFEEMAKKKNIYTKEILSEIAHHGSLKKVKDIPEEMKRVFVTTFDVSPEQHLRVQAAFQRYTDNSVSKTINLSTAATVEDVRKIYQAAYRLKLKGITIYRYGSRQQQVLSLSKDEIAGGMPGSGLVIAESEYSGGCVSASCPF